MQQVSSDPTTRYPPQAAGFPFPEARLARLFTAPAGPPTLLGLRTQYRPLWLLALGAAGNALYGHGTIVLERAVWPRGAAHLPSVGAGPNAGNAAAGGSGEMPAAPNAWPDYNGPWGGSTGGIAAGAVFTGLGVVVAATAAGLLWLDNRRLVRRNHVRSGGAGAPSYRWPNVYYATHLCGIGLIVGHRFLIEMTKDDRRPDWTWVSTLPGVVGTSIFSVTQAQSASGSELYHGKMPLWRRDVLGAAARAGVSFYILYGAMATSPNFNPYAREVVRQLAMNSFTLACFLQLTTARQAMAQRMRPAPGAVEVTSWKPAARWALWLVGRALIGFGPNLFERGYYTLHFAQSGSDPKTIAPSRHNYLQTGSHIFSDVASGTAMTTAGFFFDLWATGMMRNDGIRAGCSNLSASMLMAGATLGTGCVVAYRGVVEYAKDRLAQDTLWVSILPGMLGATLLFATVPILFSFSELRHGDIPIAQRDRLTRVLRCLSGIGFPLWCAMAAIRGFDPFGREAALIGASLCFQLANALPTTTTRRGQPQFAFPQTPGLMTPTPLQAPDVA